MLVLFGQSQRWGNLLRKLVFIYSVFHDVGFRTMRTSKDIQIDDVLTGNTEQGLNCGNVV